MSLLVGILLAPMVIAPAEPGEIGIDAFFDEWASHPGFSLDQTATGKRDGFADLSGRVQVAFDVDRLYLAAQVIDDTFQPGGTEQGDRLYFVFTPESGGARTVQVALNTLEVRPPTVHIDGKRCPGCKTAGTMRRDGWAVELSIPLARLPVADGRPLKWAARVHDADESNGTPDGVVATTTLDSALLPTKKTLRLDALAALEEGRAMFRADRRPMGMPSKTLHGDLYGDSFPEEILITEEDVVLIGRDLPERAAYLYFTHGWREDAEVERAELRDLDGQGGPELIVEHSEWSVPGEVRVAIVEVFGLHDGFLKRRFAHKTRVEIVGKGVATSAFEVVPGRKGRADRLRIGVATTADGLSRGTYYDPDPVDFPAGRLPMPWDHRRPLTFKLAGEAWTR